MVLRKLAVALLGVGVLLPGLSHALAIGDIKTRSALNEPYLGEVPLSDVGDLSADEIRVDMATPEEFHQMGVDWSSQLTDLNFQVLKRADGSTVIRVTSRHPVTEPDLDFVLRVSWPGNTSMREFVALLDLPSAKMAVAPVVPAPVSMPTSTPTSTPTPAPVENATPPTPTPAPEPATAATTREIRVHAGENLWSLAHKVQSGRGMTVEQVMIALQRRNPAAFPEHNINLLAVGHTLTVPSVAEMRRINARDAANEVARQDQAWRAAGVSHAAHQRLEKQQVNATPVAAEATSPQPAQAEVHLLAPGSKVHAQAAAQVENNARVTQVEQENSRLRQSLQQDQDKLQAQSAQIKVQDAELAKLEQSLHAQAPAPTASAPAHQVAAAKPVMSPPAPLAPKPQLPAPVAKAPAPVAKTPAPVAKAPTPVVMAPVAPAAESSSSSVVLWGAAALAALAALVGGLIALRRRRDEHRQIGELTRADQTLPVDVGPDEVHLDHEDTDFDRHLDDLHDYHEIGVDEAPTQDAIVEAHDLMQRHLYPQAIGVLNKALRAQPGRDDLRLMLMEALAEVGDHDGFAEQEQQLTADDLDTLEIVEELRSHLPAPLTPKAPESSLHDVGTLDFSAPVVESALVAQDAAPVEIAHDELADFDFALPDFDQQPSVPATATAGRDEPSPLLADAEGVLDFATDASALDFTPSTPQPATVSAASPVTPEDESIAWHTAEIAPALDADLPLDVHEEEAPVAASDSKGLDFGDIVLDEEPPLVPLEEVASESFDSEALDLDLSALDEPLDEPMTTSALSEEPLSLDELPSTDELESFALADDFDLEHESGSADLDLASQREEREEREETDWESEMTATAEAPAPALGAQEFDLAVPDTEVAQASDEAVTHAAAREEVAETAADDFDLGSEFDFLADADENATKIDLAKAYIDMGDAEGARDILQEVIHDGSPDQQEEARTLLLQAG